MSGLSRRPGWRRRQRSESRHSFGRDEWGAQGKYRVPSRLLWIVRSGLKLETKMVMEMLGKINSINACQTACRSKPTGFTWKMFWGY